MAGASAAARAAIGMIFEASGAVHAMVVPVERVAVDSEAAPQEAPQEAPAASVGERASVQREATTNAVIPDTIARVASRGSKVTAEEQAATACRALPRNVGPSLIGQSESVLKDDRSGRSGANGSSIPNAPSVHASKEAGTPTRTDP